jgi:glycosyltransferase involved in cell wall biosynthesis
LSDLISIVMPVKNAGAYLEEGLDSILNQSETNWELIAVNDHSIDKSEHILQTYANSDQRISYFNNAGDGIIPALQTAYSHASGNMIHRMDADDVMPPHKLKLLKTKLQEVGTGHVVTGKVEYFAESEVSNGYRKYEHWLNQLCEADSHWLSIYKECVIASPAWLIFRDDFEKCGGFDSTIYPEDYDLVFRFYKAGYKVESVDEVVHLWRDHSSRTSRNHPNYQQNAFFSIKLHYFFELDRDFSRPLVVWGAGPKGKIMAKLLKKRNEKFVWACNNPNKKGHDIYDKTMQSIGEIMKLPEPQILITVAQRNAQKEIRKYLTTHGLEEYKDYYFFR